jgi:hypothetical protein
MPNVTAEQGLTAQPAQPFHNTASLLLLVMAKTFGNSFNESMTQTYITICWLRPQ